MTVTILKGDCRDVLATLPDESVHCVVTSPPYFGLRDYGVAGQIGLEATPDAFVAQLGGVFGALRRVLRKDGTVWLNLGDSYGGPKGNTAMTGGRHDPVRGHTMYGGVNGSYGKHKQLLGIPWRVAFALQADGWYLRQDIIWSKPNPMPESVRDRCTKAHEYIFLLSKSERYYYDQDAIAEAALNTPGGRLTRAARRANGEDVPGANRNCAAGSAAEGTGLEPTGISETRNRRSVWEVTTQPFSEAHFATFPPALIEPCIKAGCPKGGTVLDPFGGAGTTGLVADRLGRNAILIELNPEYAAMAERRIKSDAGMFAATDLRSPDVNAFRTQKVSEADGPQELHRNSS
jgi:DNA modification methylase